MHSERPPERSESRSVRLLRRVATALGAVVLVAVLVLAVLVVRWIRDPHPETPENALIELLLDLPSSDTDVGSGRVCEQRRYEYRDASSPFREAVDGLNGYSGLSGYGWDTERACEDVATVYGAAGRAGEPEEPWLSPPQRIWAIEMRREGGRWKLCDVRDTGEIKPGFDTRMPCAPGEVSDPDDPAGCRPT